MDRDELILREYEAYCTQKENFIERNFKTNRFYITAVVAILAVMIYAGNVIFINLISAPLIFSALGASVSIMWWMNVDSYNTLIKVKYSDVIGKIEEQLPVKPFTDEKNGIKDVRRKRVFVFADIQKTIAALAAFFFFAVCVNEIVPIILNFLRIRGCQI